MPKEQKTVGIPESITLNGVTYFVKDTPELQQFIQEVAKVEKSKLYSQYEALKAQINTLSGVEVSTEKNTDDLDAIVEKLKGTFVTAEELKQILPDALKEVVQPVLQATEQNRINDLQQYREKIISENIDKCIPDLVKGNTKEELDESLRESIRIRSSYPTPSSKPNGGAPIVDPLIQQQMQQANAANNVTPTPQVQMPQPPQAQAPKNETPMPPATPRRPSPEADQTSRNIKRMTASEFAQNRDALRQQLDSMYGEGSY